MRYNPCGRIVDFTRRAYSTACVFNRNSGVASVVKWMEARPGAEVLPFESVILCRQEEPDDWLDIDVGEVANAPRTTTLARAPVGLNGAHVCGTETDFKLGGLRDELLPPVRYAALGFPECCNPPRRARGGAGASGRSDSVLQPPVRFRGGAGCSGRSAYTVEPSTTCPLLTSTCAAAPAGALETSCAYALAPMSVGWRRWDLDPLAAHEFIITNGVGPFVSWALYLGTDCDGLTLYAAGTSAQIIPPVGIPAGNTRVWWLLDNPNPTTAPTYNVLVTEL